MKPLVLYDGYCVLCNRIVDFFAQRQRPAALDYASLQSGRGQDVLRRCGLSTTELDTFVLYLGDRCWVRSSAVLKLTSYLRWPWPLLQVFLIVPEFLRNSVYDWVAGKRFDWFGRLPGE